MLYRIYTEDKNREEVENIVSKYFAGFTIIPAQGYWKGAKEDSIIVEIISHDDNLPVIETIAEEIKTVNKQESVLIQAMENPVYEFV